MRRKKLISLCVTTAVLVSLLTGFSVFGETTDRELITVNFEGTENAFDANCENVTFEGQNCGKIPMKDGSTVFSSVLDFEDVLEGSVKLSFDAYAKSTSNPNSNVNTLIIANPASEDIQSQKHDILQIFQRRIRKVTGDKANIYAAPKNGWLHIEQILNLDDGAATTKVYSMEGALLAEGEETVGCESIGSITLKNQSGNADFYVDNIIVSTVEIKPDEPDIPEVPPGLPLPVFEDFEDGEMVFDDNCTRNSLSGVTGYVGEVGLKTDTVLDFEDVSGGAVRILYDAYILSAGDRVITASPVSGKDFGLLQIFQRKINKEQSGDTIYSVSEDCWVSIEQILDLDSKIVWTKVYTQDGTLLASDSKAIDCASISKITIKNLSTTKVFNFDNLTVELYEIKPELKSTSFTMIDYSGNALTGVYGLTPQISEISMNFGVLMDSTTLSDISLQKKDGTKVLTTGESDSMVYKLSLNQGLEANTEYVVVVPATVASSRGVMLGESYTFEFETGKGEKNVNIIGFKKDAIDVTKIPDLSEGDKANILISYGNLKKTEYPVTCVITYYSGKTMTHIDTHTLLIPPGFGRLTQEIEISSLAEVDKIKAVVISDLYGMIAYHMPLIIE